MHHGASRFLGIPQKSREHAAKTAKSRLPVSRVSLCWQCATAAVRRAARRQSSRTPRSDARARARPRPAPPRARSHLGGCCACIAAVGGSCVRARPQNWGYPPAQITASGSPAVDQLATPVGRDNFLWPRWPHCRRLRTPLTAVRAVPSRAGAQLLACQVGRQRLINS
eukprot:COSAG02_NODE_7441_length_3011_cov_8.016827_1_plen_168_part_00